jgi:hypothetical protein
MSKHWSSSLEEIKDDVSLIHEIDLGYSYEFDIVAIVKDRNGYHVVSTSGCSCPSYEDVARYDSGPFETLEKAYDFIPASHRVEEFADLETLKSVITPI